MTVPLGNDQVKVGVEEVGDANAHIHVPTQEVQLLGEALNTFLAWPTHLVKSLFQNMYFIVFVFKNYLKSCYK